ncbi:MAG: hypothetical protein EZS28_025518 [Streblomastix strix]|uniref:Uncharacterized protein n=1 Tax=Streblomastix strix TaxID=222440 RepID=A0A5J4V8Y3_9EUKA|nr:MAG: hypothetical protein EZS28_025518 [Streblomastix strix]
MEKASFRPDQTANSGVATGSDVTIIIKQIIDDLESDNSNIYAPALRKLLDIVVDSHESKGLALMHKLIPLLNKFAGNVENNEEFVLSTTILHLIGVRNGTNDKTILAGAITESLIISIFSPDEKASKSGSKALCELIEENKIIRHSLIIMGFIQKVQHAFTNSSQSSSSQINSLTEDVTPYHVKCGLLDILLKITTTADDLKPIANLIPVLIDLKNNEEKELKKKADNILAILGSQGIIDPSSETKMKDEKIKQLEDDNSKLKEEIVKLKSMQSQDFPITLHNPNPPLIDFSDINATMKIITLKQQKPSTISFSQVLQSDIWSMETVFSGTRGGDAAIGIVRDSYKIPAEAYPDSEPHYQHMAAYKGKHFQNNFVCYKGIKTEGNVAFTDGSILRQEYNSGKRTVTFFVNEVQQPVYFAGVNEKVRFFIYLFPEGSSCTILSFKKLAIASAVSELNKKAVQW